MTKTGLMMDRIRHSYEGIEVLKDVSLIAEPGKLTCLLGPSGCGKTTLLRLAAGLESVQHGRIHIDEALVGDGDQDFNLAPEKRGVGLMFQDYALFPHLSIFDNVAFGIRKMTPERREWIHRNLKQMGLEGYAEAFPHKLSGGQQQRVALIRALAPEPGVLLLDEPFSGLDVTRRAQVREEMLTVVKAAGVATLMVTHDPEEAMFMGDHIVVMNQGKVVQAGTPAQAYFHPVDSFVAQLFGPLNHCRFTVQSGQVKTPFGTFTAPGLKDGVSADVMTRPEGVHLVLPNQPAPKADSPVITGVVTSSHLLGRSSHVRIQFEGYELQSRVPFAYQPECGAEVAAWIDPKQVFVFQG